MSSDPYNLTRWERRPVALRSWWWASFLPWNPSCPRTGWHDYPMDTIDPDVPAPEPGVVYYGGECLLGCGGSAWIGRKSPE